MSLIATRIQNWRINNPDFDKNMSLFASYGAMEYFINETNAGRTWLTPEMRERAVQSIGTTLQMPVLNYNGDVIVSNARKCTVDGWHSTSALITPVFKTFFVGFNMIPALYMNNEITYQRDFDFKFSKILRDLADEIDKYAITVLETNKTQVFKDTLHYTEAGNVIEATWEERMSILGSLNPIMLANKYRAPLHVIGNYGIMDLLGQLGQLGANNGIDKRTEYAGKTFAYSNNLENETGEFATGFAIEDDRHTGYLTVSGRDHILGTVIGEKEWSQVRLPLLNLPFDTITYTKEEDVSALGEFVKDLKCTAVDYYGFMIDLYFGISYNSAPAIVANPIIKFNVAEPTTGRGGLPVTTI